MDKLRNQAFPSQRSLNFFHKISQEKIQSKTNFNCEKELSKYVKSYDQRKVN